MTGLKKILSFIWSGGAGAWLLLVISALPVATYAQTPIVNNGDHITIQTGITVTMTAGFTNQTDAGSGQLGQIDNSGVITIIGNWENDAANGVFTTHNGSVELLGTTAESIQGTNTTDFNNLAITNTSASGVTLNVPTFVYGGLYLNNGIVYSSSANLLTMQNGSSVQAVSNASFVSGPVAKIGNTNFTFPVGKDAEYRPIAITGLSSSDTFTAEYFHFDPNAANAQDPGAPYNTASKDATLNHLSQCEYWILNRAGTQTANVKLSWDSYSCGVNSLSALRVAGWNGTTWKDRGNGGTAVLTAPPAGTVVSSAPVSVFGPFTLASTTTNNPLPVELLSFDAKPNGSVVDVTWTVASETNNNYYTVEHSKDGINFQEVTRVLSQGNSSQVHNYSAVDYHPYSGLSYYRLKQTDYNGDYKYSNIVPVYMSNVHTLSVFPNPANGQFYVSISGTKGDKVHLVVEDMLGQEYLTKDITFSSNDNQVVTVNPSGQLASGVYMVVVRTNDNKLYTKKIVIQ